MYTYTPAQQQQHEDGSKTSRGTTSLCHCVEDASSADLSHALATALCESEMCEGEMCEGEIYEGELSGRHNPAGWTQWEHHFNHQVPPSCLSQADMTENSSRGKEPGWTILLTNNLLLLL